MGDLPGGCQILRFPPDAPLQFAARAVIAQNSARLPDLRRTVVLLPSLRVAAEFAQALRRAAPQSALLLPRFTTLREWAADVPVAQPAIPDSRREILLYQALRGKDWFAAEDLWAVSAELACLFGELTRHRVPLPENYPDFVRRLEETYRARASDALHFEARLVHELWRALGAGRDGTADAETQYHLRLAHLAQHAAAPLYAVLPERLTPAEAEFFGRYAQQQPVCIFRQGEDDADGAASLLAAAWPHDSSLSPDGEGKAEDLRSRAAIFRAAGRPSPLAHRLRLFGAHSLEQEAQAADVQIRAWLLAGKRRIALVAQDRLTARRVRALLERAQVLVEDETGWTVSTTSASTALMRWLETVSGAFYYRDLLDLLKSPFVLHDWEAERRKCAVYRLESAIRREGVVSHLEHYARLAGEMEDGADAASLLERLRGAARLLDCGKQTLCDWLRRLTQSLELLGIAQGLARDKAGTQLLQLLSRLGEELAQDKGRFSFGEWRAWLDRQMEAAVFRDTGIASPVVFTHLPQTRLRSFDAVVLLGCDAAHLPGAPRPSMFFNESVRRELGLPTASDDAAQTRDDLLGLLARSDETLATWQARQHGEHNLISPYFERLRAFHQLACGGDLLDSALAQRLPALQVAAPAAAELPAPGARPAPPAAAGLIPATVTASGYNSLMTCPYQFFARHLLQLNPLDEVTETLEKKDYGEYVHRILSRFHRSHPVLADAPTAELEAQLCAISEAVFREALAADYLSHAWLARWLAAVPDYVAWQRGRERAGWRFRTGEQELRRELPLRNGRTLTLKGRLDRIDSGATACAVLDYKTQTAKALQEKLAVAGEDVQLPVYAALLGEPVAQAAYVSLEQGKVKEIPPEQDIAALSEAVAARLGTLFDEIHAGAPLPAQGSEAACRYCEMSGLCRKDYWSEG